MINSSVLIVVVVVVVVVVVLIDDNGVDVDLDEKNSLVWKSNLSRDGTHSLV